MVKVNLFNCKEQRFQITASDVGLSNQIFSDIFVKVTLKHVTDLISVTLEVSANALMECDRTLREFVGPISNRYVLYLHYNQLEFNDDELTEYIQIAPKQQIFDATDVIHDLLQLAIPLRKISPEAKQEPLQAVFGESTPETDHRWSPLLKLLNQ